jgi:3-oxoacyl-[acyl-carrier protein] reductase
MTDVSRTAIVTGGPGGIGAAIAARLASDGMAVAVIDLDEAGAKNAAGLVARAAQKHMVEAGFGRLIGISPTSALGDRGQVNYSAAKASARASFISGQVTYAAGGPRS